MTTTEPDDRLAIAELLAQYVLTLDADEVEQCVQLFVPDGGFEVYGKVFAGHEGLRAMLTAAPRGLHLTGQTLVSLDGDSATCRSQLLFVDASSHEMRLTLYDDVLVRVDGAWRFSLRRCRFLTPEGLSDRPGPAKGT